MNCRQPVNSVSIILAAGDLPKNLKAFASVDSILTLPAIWEPAISLVIKRELELSEKTFVVHDGASRVPDYLQIKFPMVDWVPSQRRDNSTIGDSLSTSLARLSGTSTSESRLRVIFGDTLSSLRGLDSVAVGLPGDNGDWTFAPKDFSLERIDPRSWSDESPAIAGAFTFSNLKLLEDSLSAALKRRSASSPEPFFDALFEYAKANAAGLEKYLDEEWLDFGHRANYFSLRKNQVSGRAVNTFHSTGFSLRKSSIRQEKLEKEASWFGQVPPGFYSFLPRIKIQPDGSYSMQFVEGLSISEKLLYGNPELIDWPWILGKLANWFEQSASFRASKEEGRETFEIEAWFSSHFNQRLKLIDADQLKQNVALAFAEASSYLSELTRDLSSKLAIDFGALTHGDLVFSNILVDESADLFKLIDPRGGFAERSIYGSPLYDWAKIAQCIYGRYEELASDQFELELSGNLKTVSFSRDPNRLENYRILGEWFQKACPDPINALRLAGILLLAAVDFHSDNELRMNAMILQGLTLASAQ